MKTPLDKSLILLKEDASMYRDYEVGGCRFRADGLPLLGMLARMDGFTPFLAKGEASPFFHVRYQEQGDVPSGGQVLYSCVGDRMQSVFHATAGGYRLEMEHESGERLCLWTLPGDATVFLRGALTPQMLRFGLWVGYGLMTVCRHRIAIHGSCIVKDGKAFLFLGESGTGKSTHTRLWCEYIPGATLLNDDSPIVVCEEGKVWIYGSPWSGKTPCYRAERFPLCGCVRLSQAPSNSMRRLSALQAYAALHPSCPPMFAYADALYDGISATLGLLLPRIPFYHLACRPDGDAAWLSFRTLCDAAVR